MRRNLLSLAGVALLCCTAADCCGVGGPYLTAQSATEYCIDMWCPIAVDSKLIAYYAPYQDEDPIVAVRIDKPRLADVAVVDNQVMLRARAPGDTMLHVTTQRGLVIDQWIQIAPVTRTVVALAAHAERGRYETSEEPMLVFAGARVRVVAAHLDAHDAAMLGHGLETWSATNATLRLAEDDAPWLDHGVVRDLIPDAPGPIAVSAGSAATPLELEAVPPGSTRELALEYNGTRIQTAIELPHYLSASVAVAALSEDRRPIHGTPAAGALTASTGDTTIARVSADATRQTLWITPVQAGETTLAVELDGTRREIAVRVR